MQTGTRVAPVLLSQVHWDRGTQGKSQTKANETFNEMGLTKC